VRGERHARSALLSQIVAAIRLAPKNTAFLGDGTSMAATSCESSHTDARWRDLLSGRNAIYSLTLGGSVALHALNIYIVTTIMPSVVSDIGGLDFYAWSTTAFVVASIVSASLTARIFQQAGPRHAYALAAMLFCLGTTICALAPNMAALLLGRTIQGFGGGLLYALTYAVVRVVFPERLWARAIGFESVMWGVSTLIGPAVGGIFAELGEWRMAFWSMVPFGIVFGATAFVILPTRVDDDQARERLPWPQLIALSAAVFVLSAGSIGGNLLWTAGGMCLALVLLMAMFIIEGRSSSRLLPRGALRFTTPPGAIYVTAALLMIGMQSEVFVPYFLQVLHDQSPLIAGYLAALMAMGWTVGAIVTAGWADEAERRVVVSGPAISLLGLLLMTVFLPVAIPPGWRTLLPICCGLWFVGLGIGAAWPHMVTRIYQAAPADERDLAAGAITTVQLASSALGAACAGMIANLAGIASATIPDVSAAAFWVCALLAVAPLLGVLTARRIIANTRSTDTGPQMATSARVL
jgi:MFS family permease